MSSRTKFDKNLTLSGICDTVTQETVRATRSRVCLKNKNCTKRMFYSLFHDKIRKRVFTMLRRYELTDEEWLRIEPLLPT